MIPEAIDRVSAMVSKTQQEKPAEVKADTVIVNE
jgi:hypothetical protein